MSTSCSSAAVGEGNSCSEGFQAKARQAIAANTDEAARGGAAGADGAADSEDSETGQLQRKGIHRDRELRAPQRSES